MLFLLSHVSNIRLIYRVLCCIAFSVGVEWIEYFVEYNFLLQQRALRTIFHDRRLC